MFQVAIDKQQNLLRISFSQQVGQREAKRFRQRLGAILGELQPGFQLLTDLSELESMDYRCVPEIELAMEICRQKGVTKVVRVIPDIKKDIGFTIMSFFHYKHGVPIVTCETLGEATKTLSA